MKPLAIAATLLLSGCVSIELPGLVSDTVRVTKDAYRSVTGGNESRTTLAHSYVGKETQTVAEIKQACVHEAAQKLAQTAGKERRYTVIENEISTLNNQPIANCKLAIEN